MSLAATREIRETEKQYVLWHFGEPGRIERMERCTVHGPRNALSNSRKDWMNGSPPKLRPFQTGGSPRAKWLFDGDAQQTLAAIRARTTASARHRLGQPLVLNQWDEATARCRLGIGQRCRETRSRDVGGRATSISSSHGRKAQGRG